MPGTPYENKNKNKSVTWHITSEPSKSPKSFQPNKKRVWREQAYANNLATYT